MLIRNPIRLSSTVPILFFLIYFLSVLLIRLCFFLFSPSFPCFILIYHHPPPLFTFFPLFLLVMFISTAIPLTSTIPILFLYSTLSHFSSFSSSSHLLPIPYSYTTSSSLLPPQPRSLSIIVIIIRNSNTAYKGRGWKTTREDKKCSKWRKCGGADIHQQAAAT